jgi:DNA-binding NarL/FixJ family response regulator
MPKRVLIADDSNNMRSIIKFLLQQRPELEVYSEAADGLDAVTKASAIKPDLVLLDLAMPKMNGAEAASILKKLMPDVPIVLFTMYSENIGQYLKSATGVDAILTKPDGMTRLVDAIKTVLAGSSLPADFTGSAKTVSPSRACEPDCTDRRSVNAALASFSP